MNRIFVVYFTLEETRRSVTKRVNLKPEKQLREFGESVIDMGTAYAPK